MQHLSTLSNCGRTESRPLSPPRKSSFTTSMWLSAAESCEKGFSSRACSTSFESQSEHISSANGLL